MASIFAIQYETNKIAALLMQETRNLADPLEIVTLADGGAIFQAQYVSDGVWSHVEVDHTKNIMKVVSTKGPIEMEEAKVGNEFQGTMAEVRQWMRGLNEKAEADATRSSVPFGILVDGKGKLLSFFGERDCDEILYDVSLYGEMTDILDDLASGETKLSEHDFLGTLLNRPALFY